MIACAKLQKVLDKHVTVSLTINQMVNSPSTQLDLVFGALADPTRRAILAQLASGERSVGDVARPFTTSLPAITKHLNVLEDAGLISRRVSGRQKFCRVEAKALKEASDWMERYRRFWNDQLDSLEELLAQETEP